jgi:hypothetical protein
MIKNALISITTPREKVKIGDCVRRDDGQLAIEVKGRKSKTHKPDRYDIITPIEMCHQMFGDDGEYLICKRSKCGTEIVQQDVPSFRQTQAS